MILLPFHIQTNSVYMIRSLVEKEHQIQFRLDQYKNLNRERETAIE